MGESFFGTVMEVLDDNHYAVLANWGQRVEAVTYRSGLPIAAGTRVFVELARDSHVWMISDAEA